MYFTILSSFVRKICYNSEAMAGNQKEGENDNSAIVPVADNALPKPFGEVDTIDDLTGRLQIGLQSDIFAGERLRTQGVAELFGVQSDLARAAMRDLINAGWITRAGEKAFDAEENFKQWKEEIVRLPEGFPSLSPLTALELFGNKRVTSLSQKRAKQESLDLIGARLWHHRLTTILIPPGHGATTLARYVYMDHIADPSRVHRATKLPLYGEGIGLPKMVTSKVAPIFLTWSRLGDDIGGNIRKEARLSIARSLAYRDDDASVIRARMMKMFDAEDTDHLESIQSELRQLLPPEDLDSPEPAPTEVDWDKMREVAPFLVDTPLVPLMQQVRENFETISFFIFDLSYGSQGREHAKEHLGEVALAIEDIHNSRSGEAYQPWYPSVGELYFMPNEMHFQMQGMAPRAGDIHELEPFSLTEIYTILIRQYPRMEQLLPTWPAVGQADSVVSSNFMDLVRQRIENEGRSLADVPIEEVVSMFREELLHNFNRPWNLTPYAISPYN
jgi:hypothetical protein